MTLKNEILSTSASQLSLDILHSQKSRKCGGSSRVRVSSVFFKPPLSSQAEGNRSSCNDIVCL